MSRVGTKKRVVFTTWGSFGDLHPFMALALELRQRGHTTVIATSEIYREKVESEGIGFHPVRPDLPFPESAEAAELVKQSGQRQQPASKKRKKNKAAGAKPAGQAPTTSSIQDTPPPSTANGQPQDGPAPAGKKPAKKAGSGAKPPTT